MDSAQLQNQLFAIFFNWQVLVTMVVVGAAVQGVKAIIDIYVEGPKLTKLCSVLLPWVSEVLAVSGMFIPGVAPAQCTTTGLKVLVGLAAGLAASKVFKGAHVWFEKVEVDLGLPPPPAVPVLAPPAAPVAPPAAPVVPDAVPAPAAPVAPAQEPEKK